jgi:SlyX protein
MFLGAQVGQNASFPTFPTWHHEAMNQLAAIEEKLAFLERAVNELSDVVARQQKELDRATDRHQRLLDKLSAMESDWGPSPTADEKPPHY